MANKLRKVFAAIFFVCITLMFLDFTGCIHKWFVWMAEIQLFPAILAHTIIIVAVILVATLLFGRIYCSVICPMGVFQDVVARVGRRGKRLPYSFSKEKKVLRYTVLALFIISLVAGLSAFVSILEPYSAYGRIANNLFQPIWMWGNNVLAYFAERAECYTFYTKEVMIKSMATFITSLLTLLGVAILAWRNGRTYCNTVCPVGTLLGFVSKFSVFKIKIDENKCNKCSVCARTCKASCIDYQNYTVDASRCVSCFNCIDKCNRGAIKYQKATKKCGSAVANEPKATTKGDGRREFIATSLVLATAVAKAQVLPKQVEMKVDGGLTDIDNIKPSIRQTAITPPGSFSARKLKEHCTACQLCVGACPNNVLQPSSKFDNFMQPEMSYVRGYCRPECNKCGKVCPNNAISYLDVADKCSTQIGHAVWIEKNCIVAKNGDTCFNCSRKCPTQAIKMVVNEKYGKPTPIIDTEKCIGCGACEHLCPARPYSAIYVEGHNMHRTI